MIFYKLFKNSKYIFTLIIILIIVLTSLTDAQELYVSTAGSDNNPGTLGKPFATLLKAQLTARKIKKGSPVTIYLRGGIYYLSSPIVFTWQDSGIEFKAYKNEKPVISGGCRIYPDWKPYKNGIVKAVIKNFTGQQLFVNGKLMILARYPDYDSTAKFLDGFTSIKNLEERSKNWKNPEDGYLHAMHKALWGSLSYLIKGRDDKGNLIYKGGWQNNRHMGPNPDIAFVENIFEELDRPEEWFFDRADGILYFYPDKNLDLTKARFEEVKLSNLIEFKGDEQHPVRYIVLKGIAFRQSSRTFMKTKEPLLRSDWTIYRGGAVLFNGAENCKIQNCNFGQLGGNVIFVNNFNRNINISGCHIFNSGGSGIVFLGDPDAVRDPLFQYDQTMNAEDIDKTPGPKTDNYPSNCVVEDCLINDIGRIEKQTAGVEIEMSSYITVKHCTIYNVPRAGINIGSGCWGGDIIEGCDVFNTVLETSDHGAFNSWGRDRYWNYKRTEMDSIVSEFPGLILLDVVSPNIIRNNRFRCDHGWDIDLDDGSTNYRIYDNVCLSGGIKLREGFYRTIENNIMINNSFHPHVWFKNSGDIFTKNIVSAGYFPIRIKYWGKEVDYNIFMDSTSLKEARLNKTDMHSVVAPNLFTDPASGDYRVKNNSPAFKTGFKNFDMNNFGVVSPALKKSAKHVDIPALIILKKIKDKVTEFMGMKVKSLNTLDEQSATSMSSAKGVLVLEVPPQCHLKNYIRPNDVILSFNNRPTDNVRELLEARMGKKFGKKVNMVIFRNQKEQEITVEIN